MAGIFWEPFSAQKSFLNNLLVCVCSCTILESRYNFVVNNQRIRQEKLDKNLIDANT